MNEDLASIDFSRQQAKVQWATEQKKYLCCLWRFFQRDLEVFAKVFSFIFRKELREAGFQTDAPSLRLVSQWHTMKAKGDRIWGEVHLSSFDNEKWLPVIQKLKEAADKLRINLVRKNSDDIDTSDFQYMRTSIVPHSEPFANVQEEEPRLTLQPRQISFEKEETPLVSPSAAYKPSTTTLVDCGDKKCYWCHKERLESLESDFNLAGMALSTETPPLLYRWSNIDSQGVNSRCLFLAGMGTDMDYLAPEEIGPDQFQDLVLRHLNIEQTATPFISTMQSMLTPLQRALWNKEGAIVSIFDPKKIEFSIFSAQRILQRLGKRPHGWYTGVGEYLIWWKIPQAAIICSYKVSRLVQIAEEFPNISEVLQLDQIISSKTSRKPLRKRLSQGSGKLDKEIGLVIGNLLSMLGVPLEYASLVGEGMVKSWWMEMDRRAPTWRYFLDGLNEAYQFPMSALSHTPRVEKDVPVETIFSDSVASSSSIMEISMPVDGDDGNESVTVSSDAATRTPRPIIERFDERTRDWVETLDDSSASDIENVQSEPVSPAAAQVMLVGSTNQDHFETRRAFIQSLLN